MHLRAALLALTALTCARQPSPPPAPPQAALPVAIAPRPTAPVAITSPAPVAADTEHCTCPPAPAPREPDDHGSDIDDDPQTIRTRRARARKKLPPALATRLRHDLPTHHHACDVIRSGPCTIRGDFDGDKLPDDAVLVRDANKAGGIAILWGKGSADLLGGGRYQCWTTTEVADLDGSPIGEPCLEPIDTDLSWLYDWQLLTADRTGDTVLLRHSAGKAGYPAPGALGDGLFVSGSDAAAALHRTSAGWTLMELGF